MDETPLEHRANMTALARTVRNIRVVLQFLAMQFVKICKYFLTRTSDYPGIQNMIRTMLKQVTKYLESSNPSVGVCSYWMLLAEIPYHFNYGRRVELIALGAFIESTRKKYDVVLDDIRRQYVYQELPEFFLNPLESINDIDEFRVKKYTDEGVDVLEGAINDSLRTLYQFCRHLHRVLDDATRRRRIRF
jgi:hypothetical protein